jgi:glucuronate isomerase
MSNIQIVRTLEEGLAEIPLLDIHTHLDASHLAARGLHDILLYHMLISDLVSAGCPSRERLSEDPSDAEAIARLEEAIPYLPHVQNTSIFWGVRIILRDLYGWTEPITLQNWRTLDARIRERSNDANWPREMFKRAGVRRAGTELWRRHDGAYDDILQYALEWAFFARAQWGVNDIPLYELERAWNQSEPGAPLPVTMGEGRPALARTIQTLEDVQAAIQHYVARIPYGKILSTAQHISTDIHFVSVNDEDMAEALIRRQEATPAERDIYASYILEAFLTELEKHADEIVYQFSFGAEPLPFETGSKLRQDTIFEVAAIIARHPRVRFQVFLSSQHANQSLCTLARELPNVSLAGYWWHNFFPSVMRQVMSERLDMLATNKQVGFFSDAYCADWTYAKSVLVRKQLAEVLAQKVAQGQYGIDEALSIARAILFESPQSLLGMKPA